VKTRSNIKDRDLSKTEPQLMPNVKLAFI